MQLEVILVHALAMVSNGFTRFAWHGLGRRYYPPLYIIFHNLSHGTNVELPFFQKSQSCFPKLKLLGCPTTLGPITFIILSN
jgi:hypothetical protein